MMKISKKGVLIFSFFIFSIILVVGSITFVLANSSQLVNTNLKIEYIADGVAAGNIPDAAGQTVGSFLFRCRRKRVFFVAAVAVGKVMIGLNIGLVPEFIQG